MVAVERPRKIAKAAALPTKGPIPFHRLARYLRDNGAHWYTPQYLRRFLLRKGKEQLESRGAQDVWVKNGTHYCITTLARVRQYFPGLLEATATVEELSEIVDQLNEDREELRTRERNWQKEKMALRKRISDLEHQVDKTITIVEGFVPVRTSPAALDPWAEGGGA